MPQKGVIFTVYVPGRVKPKVKLMPVPKPLTGPEICQSKEGRQVVGLQTNPGAVIWYKPAVSKVAVPPQ